MSYSVKASASLLVLVLPIAPAAASMVDFSYDDADQLLIRHTLVLGASYQNFQFDVAGVKKMVFTFDGGTDFYGESREHAW